MFYTAIFYLIDMKKGRVYFVNSPVALQRNFLGMQRAR